MIGNHSKSVKAKGGLTARATARAGTKVGLSDPVVISGNAIAQRIKATLGITGLHNRETDSLDTGPAADSEWTVRHRFPYDHNATPEANLQKAVEIGRASCRERVFPLV